MVRAPWVRVPAVSLSFITVASDSFNRADGAIVGSTLDNANGGSGTRTWGPVVGPGSGAFAISGNAARNTVDEAVLPVISPINYSYQRVTITCANIDEGVIARRSAGATTGNGYLAYRNFSTARAQLFRMDNGSITQLGTDGSVIANGDELSVHCQGDQISLLINGAVNIGPITDATYPGGTAALYGGGDGNPHSFEDFLWEAEA